MAICDQFRFCPCFHHNVPKQYRQLLVLSLWGFHAIQTSTNGTLQYTDFCQSATRFDPVFWSPARQLHSVFPVAPRGCCHHIIYDVRSRRLQSAFSSLCTSCNGSAFTGPIVLLEGSPSSSANLKAVVELKFMPGAIIQSTPVIEYSPLTHSLIPFSILLASTAKLTL